ncbi:DUF3991 domain-containing protein [Carnobacterium maltaromaticum]|uniref:DUF3991 domain-containing protein n=1 Tax=Carnobacterium maltaromaticum TaxID=2751 RepID=UPI0012FB813E|nr:DUF3991 domain-containing protein [Carnobacterium maltaromaticum]
MVKNHKERVKALEEAEKKDIVDVAQSLGMGLIKQGNNYLWDEHDSFVFNTRKNLFYWNSRQKGGGAIQLVQIVKECSRPEAIEYLNNMELGTFEAIQETKKAPFHYYMKEHKKIQVSMDYLMNDRKLSKETIQFFISHGVLAQSTYKDKESGHTEPVIVFKHKDLEGNVKGISLQGIWENHELHGKRGRLKKTYGNGFYGMSVPVGNFNENTPTSETPLRIIAFESPIDLMSYYELYKDTIGDALLVSMNGLRKGTLSTYIANQMGVLIKEEEKPDYLDKLQNLGAKTDKIHISLAVDNDEAGKLFVVGFGIDFLPVQQELPMLLEGKEKSDWNDLLKESKAGKEIPGVLKGVIKKKMDINADSKDQPITESIEIKKEEQIQKWESLSREDQNEILIVYKENPVNFRLILSKYGMEDVGNVFTGLNSFISDELVTRYNAELIQGIHDFNVERKEWLQRFDGFGDTLYIPESLWDTAEKLGLMENYPKIPFDSEETTIAKDVEQVLEMSNNEPQSEKSTQFSDDNVDPIVETTKKEENDNSRLSQAQRKLTRLENEFEEKVGAARTHLAQANGQPMNDKRGGASFLKKMDDKEEAIFSKLHELEEHRKRVEKLTGLEELKSLGLNKQRGLIMSVENIPRIKEEIERSKNGTSMFTKETIKKYEKKIAELEAQQIKVEKGLSNLSDHARSLIDSGAVSQWKKNPDIYFVKGMRKVAFELTADGDFQQSPKYQANTEEEQAKVDKLLGKNEDKMKGNPMDNKGDETNKLEKNNEKSSGNEMVEPLDRFFIVEFNETNPGLGINSYEGQIVTPELIQEIKSLEKLVPENSGYYKFYFDEVVNGEVVNHRRMDVGDGTRANKKMYDYLLAGAVTKEIKEAQLEEPSAIQPSVENRVKQDEQIKSTKNTEPTGEQNPVDTESIELKKEEQVQKWESLSRDVQNEILVVYKENPINFRVILSKYGMEDVDNVFTGLNSFISDELVTRYNSELRQGVQEFNVERKEWLQRFDGFGDTMYIPESLWDTAEKLGLMENYPKIPFDSEEDTIAKDVEQVLEMSKNEPQSEKTAQFSDENVDPIVETTKKEGNDNSRLSQAKRKLTRLENEFMEKSDATMANLIRTQGQPMNIKPEGVRFLKQHAAMEEAVFSKLDELEAQKERVENLEYQADRTALGLNKQHGLIMSIENLPLIKKEIELSKNGESMFTKETIKKYEKKVVELEAQQINVEKGLSNLSDHARSLIDSGAVNQWKKNPDTYFIKGMKVAFELTPEGDFQQSPKYLANTEEEQVKVDELLEKKVIKQKEKPIDNQDSKTNELKNTPEKSTDNESVEPSEQFIRVDFNETNPRLGIKDYEGEIVTPELIKEIQSLETLIPDTGVYYKFYFDEVVNDEVVKRSRMNVGNRMQENKEIYDYLLEGAVLKESKEPIEVESSLDTELVSRYESLPLKEQVILAEDIFLGGLESVELRLLIADVQSGEILIDDLDEDTRLVYDFTGKTDDEKINSLKKLLTVGSSESDAVSEYLDEKLELKQELEAAKEISQTDPLTEGTKKNAEPILITENGWENKMEKQEKNSGLAQLNRSMYLVDFKQAIEDVVIEMEKKEEGTSEYLTKAEVEETLNTHLTKVEQIVSHFTTSYSLMEDPTDEEKTSLLKGLLDTIAAAVREFKAELIQKLTTKKNTVIYNVQEKADNLRLGVKNAVNSRILKANEPIKKLVEKIDVKYAIEEKVVRPNPNEKQEAAVSSEDEKSVEEELVEGEVLAEEKVEVPKIGETSLVELVREYTKLVEEKKGLSSFIYQEISKNPLAKVEEVQAKLIMNQQLVEEMKEKIIAKSPLKSERETKEQEQAAIEKLANLVKQKDQLTAERNQLVEKPDFLRSSLTEKTATTSLGQFKKIDEKIDAIDKEIESIEKGLAPIVEAAAESQVEQVVEPVVEPEEIPNPNDPFVLATAAEEKNVTPEVLKENTATAKQEKSFREIIESKDYKSLTSNLTAGVKDLLNVDSLKNYLDSVNKFHTYSPKNVQLIMKQDPNAVQVASQNKWEKLGYEINPDAKEILVYAPDKNPVLDGQGQPVLDEKGKPKTTVDFYLKPVYDVSQTSAGTETLQSDIQIERKEDFSNVYHALVGSSKASTVGIGSIAGNDNGHYNPTDNSITVRQGLGQELTLKTIIQQSAQLALQGNPNEKQGVKDPLLKNFEVESVAYIVSNHVGMDTTNYSFDCLPSLKEKNHQAKEIGKSLDTISKVASGMITEIDKNLVQSKQVSKPKNKFEDRVAKANTENKKLVSEAKNQEKTQEVKENSTAKRM